MNNSNNFPEKVCRTFLCKRCEANQQPQIGTIVTTFGSESQDLLPFKIDYIPKTSVWGFTPHLIMPPTISRMNNIDFVNFELVCGINGRGLEWKFNGKVWRHEIIHKDFRVLKQSQFEALLNFKDVDYYVLE